MSCDRCSKLLEKEDNLYKLDGQILCKDCLEEMDEE